MKAFFGSLLLSVLFSLAAICSQAQTPDSTAEWVVHPPGLGGDQIGGMVMDDSGNIYIAGGFNYEMTVGNIVLNSPGGADGFIIKYRPDGAVIWARRAGGVSGDMITGIDLDDSGNVYVTGMFSDTAEFNDVSLVSAGGVDAFVAKYRPDGTLAWAVSAGGSTIIEDWGDHGRLIRVGPNGDIYVVGMFVDQAVFETDTLIGRGIADLFIARYRPDGGVVWASSAKAGPYAYPGGIAVDDSGAVLIHGALPDTIDFGGVSLISKGEDDIFTAKYGADGTFQWAKQVGGAAEERYGDIAIDRGDNIIVTGGFEFMADFNDTTLVGTGNRDVFLARYEADGTLTWIRGFGGRGLAEGDRIVLDENGETYILGLFGETLDLDGIILTAEKNRDNRFLAKLDTGGKVEWARYLCDYRSARLDHVVVRGDVVYGAGSFEKTIVLGGDTLTSAGSTDIFVWKFPRVPAVSALPMEEYDGMGVDLGARILALHPNPARDRASVEVEMPAPGVATLVVTDLLGRTIATPFNGRLMGGRTVLAIDIGGMSAGSYLVRLLTESGTRSARLVVTP